MLERVKLALLISSNDFDSELMTLISAAAKDLGVAGVDALVISTDTNDALIIQAIITYCGYQFEILHGSLERSQAFKRSYDEQKAQMSMATGYTTWSDAE